MKKNKPVKVMIVDDEAPAREKLRRYVSADPRFTVVAEAKDGQEAISNISQYHPELLLLDIQMPGLSGFDVLRLSDSGRPAVIFATAYDEYAVQAFDVSAVDYLLKPISEERLQQALNKVISLLAQNWDEKLEQVLEHLKHRHYITRLAVRHLKRTLLLDTDDISYITSEHRLVNIYNHEGRRYWTNENLSLLESRLDPDQFMRIHRSSIINLSAKFEIEPWDSGRLKLHFKDGGEIFASRDYSQALRDQFGF